MVRAYLAFPDIYALRAYVRANPGDYFGARFIGDRYVLFLT